MSIIEIPPLVEALPHSDKFQIMQALLIQLAWEEGVSLQVQAKPKTNEGQRMAAILQRMADRQALSYSIDPVVWQNSRGSSFSWKRMSHALRQ